MRRNKLYMFFLVSVFFALLFKTGYATQYYCDPVGGSMSNNGSQSSPWSSLEDVFLSGKTFNSGDVINLLSGYHGSVHVSGHNTARVTIQSAADAQVQLKTLAFTNASYWTIKGLEISPEFAGAVKDEGAIIKLSESCNNIIIENCEIYSIEDNTVWSASDWVSLSSNGINLDGDHNIIRNCIVRNIDHGIFVDRNGEHNIIENNQIFNFSGDGMRGIGNYNTFQYNIIKDNYNVDDNHDDGFQSYSIGTDGKTGTGTVFGNIIRGNTIINISDPNRPFQGALQGIGNFDGMFEDWTVENNVIISNHYNGITFLGATNCRIVNNTVIDPNPSKPGPLWIKIAAHKKGTASSGNIIRNNICSNMKNDTDIGEVDHNEIISSSDYSDYFVDYLDFDFRLKKGCQAIGSGSIEGAPETDINGVNRITDNSVDIGAYEYGDFVDK